MIYTSRLAATAKIAAAVIFTESMAVEKKMWQKAIGFSVAGHGGVVNLVVLHHPKKGMRLTGLEVVLTSVQVMSPCIKAVLQRIWPNLDLEDGESVTIQLEYDETGGYEHTHTVEHLNLYTPRLVLWLRERLSDTEVSPHLKQAA